MTHTQMHLLVSELCPLVDSTSVYHGCEEQARVSREFSSKVCFLGPGTFMVLCLPTTKTTPLLLSPAKCHTSPLTRRRCLLMTSPSPLTVTWALPCVQESGDPHIVYQRNPLCRLVLRSWTLLRMHGLTVLRSCSRFMKERRQNKRDKEAYPCRS